MAASKVDSLTSDITSGYDSLKHDDAPKASYEQSKEDIEEEEKEKALMELSKASLSSFSFMKLNGVVVL